MHHLSEIWVTATKCYFCLLLNVLAQLFLGMSQLHKEADCSWEHPQEPTFPPYDSIWSLDLGINCHPHLSFILKSASSHGLWGGGSWTVGQISIAVPAIASSSPVLARGWFKMAEEKWSCDFCCSNHSEGKSTRSVIAGKSHFTSYSAGWE